MSTLESIEIFSLLEKNHIIPISLPTPFPVGPVNCFLFKKDPITLFDTGLNTDESHHELCRQLSDHGLIVNDIEYIVVTHGHRDHMGLLGRLMDETNAKAIGQARINRLGAFTEEDVTNRKNFFIGILKEFGVPLDIRENANSLYERFRRFSEPFVLDSTFEEGEKVLGYETYFVPGHSPTDTIFTDHENGVSVTGDHILTNTNPNPLLRRPTDGKPRDKSLVEYQASLRKSRELDLGLCLPGHGQPFDNHVEVVDGILEKQQRRAALVLKLVQQGKTTPFQVSKKLFPDLPPPHMHLGLSVSVGHLEVLEEDGVLKSHHDSGVLHFTETK